MASVVKAEVDDGQWSRVPGLGNVRSAPRHRYRSRSPDAGRSRTCQSHDLFSRNSSHGFDHLRNGRHRSSDTRRLNRELDRGRQVDERLSNPAFTSCPVRQRSEGHALFGPFRGGQNHQPEAEATARIDLSSNKTVQKRRASYWSNRSPSRRGDHVVSEGPAVKVETPQSFTGWSNEAGLYASTWINPSSSRSQAPVSGITAHNEIVLPSVEQDASLGPTQIKQEPVASFGTRPTALISANSLPWTKTLNEPSSRHDESAGYRSGFRRSGTYFQDDPGPWDRSRSRTPDRSRDNGEDLYVPGFQPNSYADLECLSSVPELDLGLASSASLSPATEGERKPPCICPIDLQCPNRGDNLLDCRTLVVQYEKWIIQNEEDPYWITFALGNPGLAKVATVARIRDIIHYCNYIETGALNYQQQNFDRLFQWIAEMRQRNMTQDLIDQTGVLQVLEGFLEHIAPDRAVSIVQKFTIEALTVLFRKWRRGDFDCDPNRGLLRIEKYDGGILKSVRYQIDKTWAHYNPATYYGEGDLVNGQMWYSRVQLQRDGVHAASIAGISGSVAEGARSIVMGLHNDAKKQYYADVDLEHVIEYEGTALPEKPNDEDSNVRDDENEDSDADDLDEIQPTACTRMLMRSLETGVPVRVIRSWKLANIVYNKPLIGYRYDGLYRVKNKILQKKERQIWTFRMVREPNQGPLRGLRLNKAGTQQIPRIRPEDLVRRGPQARRDGRRRQPR